MFSTWDFRSAGAFPAFLLTELASLPAWQFAAGYAQLHAFALPHGAGTARRCVKHSLLDRPGPKGLSPTSRRLVWVVHGTFQYILRFESRKHPSHPLAFSLCISREKVVVIRIFVFVPSFLLSFPNACLFWSYFQREFLFIQEKHVFDPAKGFLIRKKMIRIPQFAPCRSYTSCK